MPQQSAAIDLDGYDGPTTQGLAYGTLLELSWELKYAAENLLVAYTKGIENRSSEEVSIETTGTGLSITSKLVRNESFDLTGRNKKNIAKFLAALDRVKGKITEQELAGWKEALMPVREQTLTIMEQEINEAAEIDKVMNLSTSNLNLTYGIIGINVAIFLVMALSGVSILTPTGWDIVNWGGNFLPLTLAGEWWRVLTCVFVHIGIIHLLFNMYALFTVGVYLEPMLGKTRFITGYLCTGVFASLASLWWHDTPIASAGASGAIFGMYGVFLALLSTNLIPKKIRNSLLNSIGVFALFNLAYGMKAGIDNAAHVGGLLSGLIIGYVYYFQIKKGSKNLLAVAVISVTTILVCGIYIKNNTSGFSTITGQRSEDDGRVKNIETVSAYGDNEKYLTKFRLLLDMQERALGPLEGQLYSYDLEWHLKNTCLPEWERAEMAVQIMRNFDVSEPYKKKIKLLGDYVALRKREVELLIMINESKNVPAGSVEHVQDEIEKRVAEINGL